MASLNEIKKRIKIVESTAKITKAMKLVATAKLKKQKIAFQNQGNFYSTFYDVFSYLINKLEEKNLVEKRDHATKNIWIVIFSNMGLCGSFNLNIVKELQTLIQKDDEIVLIGKKGKSLIRSKGIENKIIFAIEIEDKEISYDLCYLIASNIANNFINQQDIKSIKLLYTKFINSLSFMPRIYNLLPLDKKEITPRIKDNENDTVFSIEPNADEVTDVVLGQFVSTCLYGGILESKVCENASRRNAMDAATKNADELIKNYKLEFNRKRQSDITQEITEIVSGSNVGE